MSTIQRTAYFLELMAANEIKGADEYGVYSYVKHFALNDQETNRIYQLCLWSTEQAIRETYLKAFEIAVKEGHTGAVMDAHCLLVISGSAQAVS